MRKKLCIIGLVFISIMVLTLPSTIAWPYGVNLRVEKPDIDWHVVQGAEWWSVRVTIHNQGAAPSNSGFYTKVWLWDNDTGTGTELFTWKHSFGIPGNGEITIPLLPHLFRHYIGPGDHHKIKVITDTTDIIVEFNENDNVAFSDYLHP